MNCLPKAHQAIIDERKITEYLLSPEHPYGRPKAQFFNRLGATLCAVWFLAKDNGPPHFVTAYPVRKRP